MNPTASAPIATAKRASSSLVIPQIFTNMHRHGTATDQHTAASISVRSCRAVGNARFQSWRNTQLSGDECGNGCGRVAAGDQRFTDQYGVIASGVQRAGVSGATHPTLGHPHNT